MSSQLMSSLSSANKVIVKRPINRTHTDIFSKTATATATASTGEHNPNVNITSKLLNTSLQNIVRILSITMELLCTIALLWVNISSFPWSQYSGHIIPCKVLRNEGHIDSYDTQCIKASMMNGKNSCMEYPIRSTGMYEVRTTDPH